MTELPKLAYPWFAYPDGPSVVCAKCRQWISQDEPRAWSAASKAVMHLDCRGVELTGGHGSAREQPSPPSETTEGRIERMHAEKMAMLGRIAIALEALR